MKTRFARFTRPAPAFLTVATAVVLAVAATQVSTQGADAKSVAPAKVENGIKEGELATLRLTPQAEQRLGIVLVEASRKKIGVTRLFGGDVLVPLVPNTPTASPYFPLASSTPEELLVLSDRQAVADGDVEKARVQVDAAQRTHRRAQKLIQEDAGSVRAAEDAEAQARLAEKALEVAQARRALLGTPVAEALRGQRLWVRVPVYAGELRLVDAAKEARVGELGTRPGETDWVARPVPAPPSANARASTVDLFYEIAGPGGSLKPGQRIAVRVPVRGEEESLVVPWAAVLQDIHGNTWVYESVAPQTFTRRRVTVVRVLDGEAVLASGPKPGSKVVTEGAAELFGTEFGGGK